MSMVDRSLWLDTAPATISRAVAASARAAAASTPSVVLGRVVATPAQEPELAAGWVRCEVPADAPTSTVTGPTEGGVFAVGALCLVHLDAAGKVTSIDTPVTLPDGAEPVALGQSGERVLAATAEAAEAVAQARVAVEGVQVAQERADAVAADLEAEKERVTQALDEARNGEVTADRLRAAEGTIDADYVRNLVGDRAFLDAILANRVVVAGDPTNKVGAILLEDGAVTAEKIDAESVASATAEHIRLSTDQLYAGTAKISGDLIADTIMGKTIMGSRFVGGEIALDDQVAKKTVTLAYGDFTPGHTIYADWEDITSGTYSYRLKSNGSSSGWDYKRSLNLRRSSPLYHLTSTGDGITVKGSFSYSKSLNDGASIYASFRAANSQYGNVSLEYPSINAAQNYGYEFTVPSDLESLEINFAPNSPLTVGTEFRASNVSIEYYGPTDNRLVLSRNESGIAELKAQDGAGGSTTLTSSGLLVSSDSQSSSGEVFVHPDSGGPEVLFSIGEGTSTTSLRPDGIRLVDAGVNLGFRDWRTFVAPPFGWMWKQIDRYQSLNGWQYAWLGGGDLKLSGGMTKYDADSFLIPITGMYLVIGHVEFYNGNTTNGRRGIAFRINGKDLGGQSDKVFYPGAAPETGNRFTETMTGTTGYTQRIAYTNIIRLNAGDNIKMWHYMDYVQSDTRAWACDMSVRWISEA